MPMQCGPALRMYELRTYCRHEGRPETCTRHTSQIYSPHNLHLSHLSNMCTAKGTGAVPHTGQHPEVGGNHHDVEQERGELPDTCTVHRTISLREISESKTIITVVWSVPLNRPVRISLNRHDSETG
jgi:hypothetical protein